MFAVHCGKLPCMRPDARTLWVGLAKFLAVVVGGTAVGAGIGIALSALSGNGGNESTASPRAIATPSAEARTPTPTSTARTPKPTSTARTPTPTGTAVPAGEGLGLRVESARLISATNGPAPGTGGVTPMHTDPNAMVVR